MLRVNYDRETKIVNVTTEGFLTLEDVERFIEQYRIAAAESRAHCGEIFILIDSSRAAVQSKDVMDRFTAANALFAESNRMAVLFESNLAKMQATRLFNKEKQQGFLDREEALAWLISPRG